MAQHTGCELPPEGNGENAQWWPVLYEGRSAGEDVDGIYIWKLRDKLSKALDQTDLANVSLYADNGPSLWKISHGAVPEGIRLQLEKRSVVTVNSNTKAKGISSISQGSYFTEQIRKGDYFLHNFF